MDFRWRFTVLPPYPLPFMKHFTMNIRTRHFFSTGISVTLTLIVSTKEV
jgi:hypothetical protein